MGFDVYYAGSARIGVPREARVFESFSKSNGFASNEDLMKAADPVHLGEGVYIGDNSTIYEGTSIGNGCILEDQTRIGFDCILGARTRVMYAAYICDRVAIGDNCRIAGFVCDAAKIGDDCTVMGQLSHKYTVSDLEWGEVDEPSPIIENGVIIGLGAQIVGGITVGKGSFVCSGAVLTKSIPKNSVVSGHNQIRSINEWPGAELRDFFSRRREIDYS